MLLIYDSNFNLDYDLKLKSLDRYWIFEIRHKTIQIYDSNEISILSCLDQYLVQHYNILAKYRENQEVGGNVSAAQTPHKTSSSWKLF